jgi:hypothetical protein
VFQSNPSASDQTELVEQLHLEPFQVPVTSARLRAQVIGRAFHRAATGRRLQFLAVISLFKQLAAQTINRHALLVHHIIVFDQVFADREVVRFNVLLSASIRLLTIFDSMATPSSIPSRCMIALTRSPANIRIRSSSSER